MSSVATQPAVKAGHPKGLYLLFFTELWERFGYYGMRGLLILFLTKAVMEGGLGIAPQNATVIYGWFTGLVYLTPIAGGWLADNFIGQRRSILIGGLLMALGYFSLAGTVSFGPTFTWLGMGLIIIGNGFFKPNISTLVGKLYSQDDPRRDSAFTIFYMGINLGALFAPLICGFFAEDLFATKQGDTILKYAFQYGFAAAGVGMVLGQIIFNLFAPKLLGEIGLRPEGGRKNKDTPDVPLTKEEKDRVKAIFIITVFVLFFWAGFEQAGSSLSLYTDKYIDRSLGSFLIPTSWFQSVNPLFIVMLAPLAAGFWVSLARKGKDWRIPVKMGVGMILLGIGFLFMVGAVLERGGNVESDAVKASLMWLIITYLLHTIGELFLSPIGLSMITRLAPIQYASALMGVWFLAPFLAQVLGGYIAAYVEKLGALEVFGLIAGFVIVAGLVLIGMSKKLTAMMHGRG